jgi:vacuolar iron transporter family protein
MIPLTPFIFLHATGLQISVSQSFLYSVGFTCGAFFLIGLIKGRIVKKYLVRSGLITLLIGSIAATVAYLVGHALSTIIR